MIIKKLYYIKYRPKNLDGMILLPRIQKRITDINNNIVLSGHLLLHGSAGTGKTSLAEIIVPKDAMRINGSYNSSVEDLRNEVTDYCRTADIFNTCTIAGYKILHIEEIDGLSKQYQEALRAFMEDYTDKLRIIATCNNILKLSEPIQERFQCINFDPQNMEEINYLKSEYLERGILIKDKNNLKITSEEIKSFINISFPSLRQVMNMLQDVEITDGQNLSINSGLNSDLFSILFDKHDTEKTYAWVIENYGDKVENLIKSCGRPLADYILDIKKEYINKITPILNEVTLYGNMLLTTPDPITLAISLIFNLQLIINKK